MILSTERLSSKLTGITINVTYTSKSIVGFYAALDFELKAGKVDWEIVNPKNKTIYSGYVIFENGNVFRELIYSSYPFNGGYPSGKEGVKNEIDKSGKQSSFWILPIFNLIMIAYLESISLF